MASKNVISTIFEVIDKATAPLQQMGRSFGALAENMRTTSTAIAATGERIGQFGNQMQGVGKTMSMSISASILGLGGYALKAAADMESLTAEFEVMLASAEKAGELTKWIKQYAAATPFGIEDLSQSIKTMMSFGISMDDAKNSIKMLGDVAGSSPERLKQLSLVFAQVQAAGKLTGGDLLQLINVGFNPLQVISQKSGKSMAVLREEMSKGAITAEMVKDAFKSATSEGGLFFGNMEKQSKTLAGRFSTFMDAIKTAAGSLGDFLNKNFKLGDKLAEAATWIEKTTASLQEWITANPGLFKGIVMITGALAVLGPALIAIGTAITFISMAMSGFAILMSPVTLIILGIAALAFVIIKYWKPISGFFKNLWSGIINIAKTTGSILYNTFIQPFVDLWNGVQVIFGYIKNSIKNMIDILPNWAKDKLGLTNSIKTESVNVNTGSLKQTVENKNKMDANITLSLPDGMSAKTDKFQTTGAARPNLNVKYNTGLVFAQ